MYITIHDPITAAPIEFEANLRGVDYLISENQDLKQENEILKQKIISLESKLEEMTQRYLYR